MAVVRKETGVIHFYVNGEDQGPAAANVPDRIYGVIDLYGQAAQVSEILTFMVKRLRVVEPFRSSYKGQYNIDLYGHSTNVRTLTFTVKLLRTLSTKFIVYLQSS